MRVLIACEFSGIIRNAFRARYHDAWSCDLLPAEDGSQFHIQTNVQTTLDRRWDLMIAHPPCTYLCNSGVRWLAPKGKLDRSRHLLMQKACDFFAALYHAPIPRICIENPIMHKYARDYLQSAWKVPPYDQIIQPFEHGHGETKSTCLWVQGLKLITPSKLVPGRTPRVHFASPTLDRWKVRSRSLAGIALAFASQWG